MGQEARGGQEPSPREPRKGGSQSPALTLRTLPGVLGASPRRLLGVRGALPYSISVSVCFLFLSCCVKVRSKSRKSQDGKRPEMGQKQCQEWSVQAPYPGLPLQPPPPPPRAETLGCSHPRPRPPLCSLTLSCLARSFSRRCASHCSDTYSMNFCPFTTNAFECSRSHVSIRAFNSSSSWNRRQGHADYH